MIYTYIEINLIETLSFSWRSIYTFMIYTYIEINLHLHMCAPVNN